MKKIIVAILAAIALFSSAPANADSNDDAFLRVLAEQGIGHVSGSAGLIKAAKSVCVDLYSGYSVREEAWRVYLLTSLDAYDSGYFLASAVWAYCPTFNDEVQAFTESNSTAKNKIA